MEKKKYTTMLDYNKAYIEIGPVSLEVYLADATRHSHKLFIALEDFIFRELSVLAASTDILKKNWTLLVPDQLNEISAPIYNVVKNAGDDELTLMVAIAGYMSDRVLHFLAERGVKNAYVNNGGDIALMLEEGRSFNLGIMPSVKSKAIASLVKISSDDNIGGVATSGFGGRSFTLGIADAVTVFAKNAITADVYATVIANKSYIDSPRIHTTKAKNLDANSDIAELSVVVKVEELSKEELARSKKQLLDEARKQHQNGNIINMIGFVQGEKVSLF